VKYKDIVYKREKIEERGRERYVEDIERKMKS